MVIGESCQDGAALCPREILPFGCDHTHVPGRLPSHGVACIKASDEVNVCGIVSGNQPTKGSMLDLLEEL